MVKRNPFKTIIVTGVPGVGKTTVLKKLVEEAEKKGIKIKVTNFGDYMFKTALKNRLVADRDSLRKLSHRKQLELQQLAAREIILDAEKELGEQGILIVDTHTIVKTTAGYWPGLPQHVVKELSPDSIVLIEADPKNILSRQLADKGRERSDVGGEIKVIEEIMLIARMAAFSSATLTASSVYIVENPENKIEEPVKKILELLERL